MCCREKDADVDWGRWWSASSLVLYTAIIFCLCLSGEKRGNKNRRVERQYRSQKLSFTVDTQPTPTLPYPTRPHHLKSLLLITSLVWKFFLSFFCLFNLYDLICIHLFWDAFSKKWTRRLESRTTLLFAFHIALINLGKVLFTNPSARAGYDTRSIFKRSLTGFEFRVFLLLD